MDHIAAAPLKALPDPADRFIVATATHLGLPLVTRDAKIASSGAVDTIW